MLLCKLLCMLLCVLEYAQTRDIDPFRSTAALSGDYNSMEKAAKKRKADEIDPEAELEVCGICMQHGSLEDMEHGGLACDLLLRDQLLRRRLPLAELLPGFNMAGWSL